MNVLALQRYGTLLPLDWVRFRWCGSIMLSTEMSPGFIVVTTRWVKVVAVCLSCFCLALAVASIITALCHSYLVPILVLDVLIWHNVAQNKSLGRPLTLCTVCFHMTYRRACTRYGGNGFVVTDERRRWGP